MRKIVKKDLLVFALPAFVVYLAGAAVSLWDFAKRLEGLNPVTSQSLNLLSLQGIIGLALVGSGLILNLVAAGTLRRFYSSTLVIRSGHRLITHGVYRFTRHPIYLGVVMVSTGMAVTLSSLYGFLIMLILIPIILNRIRMEERMLIDEFGDEYRTYRATTSKLIPFIY
jgi:protein-S-isoprenylcysteine O-methyltransferase Ste14